MQYDTKAQEMYEELKENLGDQDVHILHSRLYEGESGIRKRDSGFWKKLLMKTGR